MAAQFSMTLEKTDPFREAWDKFNGTLVFNARGGCFFITNGIGLRVKSQCFKSGDTSKVKELKLTDGGNTVGVLKDFEIKLLGEKRRGADSGLIVRFIKLAEPQLDTLNTLVDTLRPVSGDSELFPDDCDAA